MKKILGLILMNLFQFVFSQQTITFKLKNYRIATLNDSIQETSGLNFLEGKLYTFNDSGNPAEIFEISTDNGKINNVFKTEFINKDWEAITSDSIHFYIGDFGNNSGTRKDLKIYKTDFKSLDKKENTQIDSLTISNNKEISFYYPEQKDFSSRLLKTDFDAEAMVYHSGKLHVFTKEWDSKATTHYIIDPNLEGNQPAQKLESYKTGYAVTDAYYYDKKLYVVGYTKMTDVYLDIFSESEDGLFFKENPQHYHLGSALSIGQIEGIAVNEKGIYISSERFKTPITNTPPYLYFIPKEKLQP